MTIELKQSKTAPSARQLAAIFKQCGITLTKAQTEQFWLYHGMLRRHNRILNLTRIHNFTNMVIKLYIDSVLPAMLTNLPSPLMDLGSGPGMPGIPLKIWNPELEIWLAEGRAKRAAFLQAAREQLGFEDLQIVNRNIDPAFDRPVAAVITRAVESIEQTMSRVQGCLEQNGRLIFMKGPGCEPEIESAGTHFGNRFALVENRCYRIGDTPNERRLVIFERRDASPRAMAEQAARRHRVVAVASEANSRYKALKKLLSGRGLKKAGQALMSGERQVREMLARFPERCLSWISNSTSVPPPPDSPERLTWMQLTDSLFKTLDIFGTRFPLLCIEAPAPEPWDPEEGLPPGCSVLAPFQDPENIGAAIRSAAAFGATQVILLAESAYPYHPKALRASAGSTPLMRLRRGPSVNKLTGDLPILALSAEGRDIAEVHFPEAFGLLAGMEGQGLPPNWRQGCIRIPIQPAVESINAAAAVSVALYEWSRRHQRR